MTKAEMMKSLKERRANPEGTSSSHRSSKGKRKTSSEGEGDVQAGTVMERPRWSRKEHLSWNGERRKKRHHEEKTTESARATVPKDPMGELSGTAGKAPKKTEQQSIEVPYVLLDTSEISFVAKPSSPTSLDIIRRLVPDQYFDLVKGTPDLKVLEAVFLHFMQVTRAEVQSSKAQEHTLKAQLLRSEEENKTLQAEVERLKGEVENSWHLGKEKFLQYKEFDTLCSGRASVFFKEGFNGFLAQFMANGYSEEEHPALFLDVEQALADMPEESDEGSSDQEEVPPPNVFSLLFCIPLMKSTRSPLLLSILLRLLSHMHI
ncbi:Embryo defective 3006 isoform 1 [Dorcoceras hygrometricum]|uniref:Embryo defective 3006 isoform 1 n=1 Tax=Dorcoceras hygrometricum TaxID=472368 RepID=A0A2Z7CY44_9LAMI|nr:Embryo defective 3006 isoform 1 [Dorcoceras hygrometricum]